MANNRSQTARKNLKSRQADYDGGGLKPHQGFVRPGSQNHKKQGAGGESGGKRR